MRVSNSDRTPKLYLRGMAIFRRFRSYGRSFARRALGNASGVVGAAVGRSAVRIGSRLASMAFKKTGRIGGAISRIGTNEAPVVSYKSRGRRLSRGQRRFARRVLEVVNGHSPLQTYIQDNGGTTKTGSADQVTRDSFSLCGLTIPTNQDDIRQMFYSAYSLASDAACAGYRLQFRSACLDCNLTNIGTSGCLVDVYFLLSRRPYGSAVTIDTQFANQFAEQSGTVSAVNTAVTPFQNPGFLTYWKVTGHKSVHLKVGESMNFQVRQNVRKWLDGKVLTTQINAIPQWTKGLLFEFRGEPEDNAGTPRYSACKVAWKARKTYSYQFPADRNRDTTVES